MEFLILVPAIPVVIWFGWKILRLDTPEDPVAHCPVFKNIGCAHVDGMICDMKTCNILRSYKEQK